MDRPAGLMDQHAGPADRIRCLLQGITATQFIVCLCVYRAVLWVGWPQG